eukprot:SAG31_NODE_262_length_18842_cov_22.033346_10_plen_82_part_00
MHIIGDMHHANVTLKPESRNCRSIEARAMNCQLGVVQMQASAFVSLPLKLAARVLRLRATVREQAELHCGELCRTDRSMKS